MQSDKSTLVIILIVAIFIIITTAGSIGVHLGKRQQEPIPPCPEVECPAIECDDTSELCTACPACRYCKDDEQSS